MKRLPLSILITLVFSSLVACGGMSLDTNMPTDKAMALNAKVQGYYKALTGSIKRLESNASNIAIVPTGAKIGNPKELTDMMTACIGTTSKAKGEIKVMDLKSAEGKAITDVDAAAKAAMIKYDQVENCPGNKSDPNADITKLDIVTQKIALIDNIRKDQWIVAEQGKLLTEVLTNEAANVAAVIAEAEAKKAAIDANPLSKAADKKKAADDYAKIKAMTDQLQKMITTDIPNEAKSIPGRASKVATGIPGQIKSLLKKGGGS